MPGASQETEGGSEGRGPWYLAWQRFKKNKVGMIGCGVLVFFIVLASLSLLMSSSAPNLANRLLPPSQSHPFGTDDLGRDVFVMCLQGAGLSLYVGVTAVAISTVLGVAFGALSGYFGGLLDNLIMRLTDLMLTLPQLILNIVAISMFGVRSIELIILIFSFFGWPNLARIVRSEFMSLREGSYVEVAKVFGADDLHAIFGHILPNAISPIATVAALNFAIYVLSEADLSFLGFGDPGVVSWGRVLAAGRSYLGIAWWISTFPGLLLFIASLGLAFLGEGLRDVLATVE